MFANCHKKDKYQINSVSALCSLAILLQGPRGLWTPLAFKNTQIHLHFRKRFSNYGHTKQNGARIASACILWSP